MRAPAAVVNIAVLFRPFGGLWLNTLLTRVVPLVVSLLNHGVASVADTYQNRRPCRARHLLFTMLVVLNADVVCGWLRDLAARSGARFRSFVAGWGVSRHHQRAADLRVMAPGLAPYNQSPPPRRRRAGAGCDFSIFFGFRRAATSRRTCARRSATTAMGLRWVKIVHWVLLAGPSAYSRARRSACAGFLCCGHARLATS